MNARYADTQIENLESKIKHPNVLFVHNHPTKFIQMDLALLRERYEVREWYQKSRVVNLVALARAIRASDLVFGWFASWHTLFPVLLAKQLKRPTILVVGGYDTANLPDIGYGSMHGGFKKWVALTTMWHATALQTFSEYSRREAIANAHIPDDRIKLIPLGIANPDYTAVAKEKIVITVGNVNRENLRRKGLESFVRAAASIPKTPFVLIGAWRDNAIDFLKSIATPNVTFTGWVSEETRNDYYVRAKVYVQASRHEGFGLAVAEAMQYECIPVVTHAGALPEVVGDAGIYVDSTKPHDVAAGVKRAIAADAEWGRHARARITRAFPMEQRREKLYQLLDASLN